MGVDDAMVTCGLNVPEEDKYSYNHSKKVHSTSRAALDKTSRLFLLVEYNNVLLLVCL